MSPDMRRHVADLMDRVDVAEVVRRRVVQHAIGDALALTWTRRGEMFDWATSRPGDYPGGPVDWETGEPLAPPPPLVQAPERCRLTALACRRKASLLEARWIDA